MSYPTPSPPSRPEDLLPVRILRGVNTLFTHAYHNVKVLTPSRLPGAGPGIVVCNHISPLDPLLIQSACGSRLIMWLMAKEYMTIPGMGRIFKTLQVIPVDRGSRETTPMRSALKRLEEGHIIGIFPEGRISASGDLLQFHPGVAQLGIRAKVPVFPVYLDGTQRNLPMKTAFLRPCRCVMAFGPEVEFDRSNTHRPTLDAAMKAILTSLLKLKLEVDEFRKVH